MLLRRREFLVNTARIAGGLAIAACTPTAAPSGTTGPGGATPAPTVAIKKDLIAASSVEVVDGQPYNQTISGMYGRVFPGLYDTVIRRDPATSKLAPGVATSWRSVDPTTWEIKIRTDVKFHNGDALTPADIKWSLEHTVDPEAKTIDTATFRTIDRIDVVDGSTLRIITKKPDPFIADKLAVRPGWVVPSEHFKKVGVQGMNEHPIGSGPYMFKERVTGVSFTMVRNPNYWRGQADADSVTVLFRPDAAAQVAALKTGEVNFIAGIGFDQIDDLTAHPNTKVVVGRDNGIQHYIINTQVKPLDDKRVRQALSLAVDRELLNKTLGKGIFEIASGPIASFEFAFDPSRPPLAYDPDRAKALLAEAGYAGEPIILEYVPGGSGEQKDLALASQWEAVGLKIQMQAMDAATRARKISTLGFLGLTSGRTASRYFDPDNVVWRALQPGGTRRYWTDPEFDRLGIEQASSTDQDLRQRNWQRMADIMLDHMPIIYLWVEPVVLATSRKIDFTPTVDQLDDWGPGQLKFNA